MRKKKDSRAKGQNEASDEGANKTKDKPLLRSPTRAEPGDEHSRDGS